jgi:hypothetical protein
MKDPRFAAPPLTAIYDYGVLPPDGAGSPRCPCGRTDRSERAEQMIAEYLRGAPVGSQAVILVRNMARDGATGPAHIYALAERGERGVVWPTYHGSTAPQVGEHSM